MDVYETLSLAGCADQDAWRRMFEQEAVNGVATPTELPQELRARVLSVGESAFSVQLRAIRAVERAVPESLLRMTLR